MPKIRYLGPEDEVTCRGGTWSRTKWTDSTTTNADDDDIAVLMGNPYFSVEDDVPADDPAPIEPPSPRSEEGRDGPPGRAKRTPEDRLRRSGWRSLPKHWTRRRPPEEPHPGR